MHFNVTWFSLAPIRVSSKEPQLEIMVHISRYCDIQKRPQRNTGHYLNMYMYTVNSNTTLIFYCNVTTLPIYTCSKSTVTYLSRVSPCTVYACSYYNQFHSRWYIYIYIISGFSGSSLCWQAPKEQNSCPQLLMLDRHCINNCHFTD